tara:strand:- start:4080 stop:4244 length:165 start_codon:yes stop_codon:yes gene_type:complete
MNKRNKKCRQHGYWERKYNNGKLWCKYTLNNEMWIGYGEAYDANGKIDLKGICI